MSQELSQLSETPPLPGAVAIPNINKIIQTIATDFAGPDDPAAIAWPYCTWADTGNNLKKRRNAANNAWVVEGELFQRTARQNGDGTQNFNVASLNGGQLAGFRNKILNGRFNINQGVVASRTAVANSYNFDQWYYDGTYLYQPVPTEDVYNGTYTLSWEGDSTAAWSLNALGASVQNVQTYTPISKGGQIVVSGKTDQHLWVRFATDLANLNKVQLEPGIVATPFEERPKSLEEFLCMWFFELVPVLVGLGISYPAGGGYVAQLGFRNRKRVVPTYLGTVNSTEITPTSNNVNISLYTGAGGASDTRQGAVSLTTINTGTWFIQGVNTAWSARI